MSERLPTGEASCDAGDSQPGEDAAQGRHDVSVQR